MKTPKTHHLRIAIRLTDMKSYLLEFKFAVPIALTSFIYEYYSYTSKQERCKHIEHEIKFSN